jgi:phosphate transport system substrate-binding protein
MKRRMLAGLFGALAAVCAAQAQVLEVSGATTMQRRVLEPGAEPLKAATGIQLKVYGPGTGKGLLALIDGKVPVAAVGESLDDAVASARAAAAETGRPLNVPANLVFHPVANDNIVVAVHPSNPVKSLTRAQVRDLMNGKVTNWSEVGGPNLPVKVYAAAQGQAVRTLVQKSLLDGAAYGPAVMDIRTALEQLRVIAAEPGGVGAMSEPVIRASTEKLRVVPGASVPRPIGFVTVGAPSAPAQKMIDYFRSPEGQKQIR